jgi:uncharacterized protein YndB with AHSA1/START domain
VELHETILIGRSRETVFDAWARIDRAGRHHPAVVARKRLTDGSVGAGTRYRAVDRWPLREVAYTVEITAFERPGRIAATWSNPLSGGWDAIFEPHGERTEMRFHATVNPTGLDGLPLRLFLPWYRRQVRAFLDSFRRQLEAEPRQPL